MEVAWGGCPGARCFKGRNVVVCATWFVSEVVEGKSLESLLARCVGVRMYIYSHRSSSTFWVGQAYISSCTCGEIIYPFLT